MCQKLSLFIQYTIFINILFFVKTPHAHSMHFVKTPYRYAATLVKSGTRLVFGKPDPLLTPVNAYEKRAKQAKEEIQTISTPNLKTQKIIESFNLYLMHLITLNKDDGLLTTITRKISNILDALVFVKPTFRLIKNIAPLYIKKGIDISQEAKIHSELEQLIKLLNEEINYAANKIKKIKINTKDQKETAYLIENLKMNSNTIAGFYKILSKKLPSKEQEFNDLTSKNSIALAEALLHVCNSKKTQQCMDALEYQSDALSIVKKQSNTTELAQRITESILNKISDVEAKLDDTILYIMVTTTADMLIQTAESEQNPKQRFDRYLTAITFFINYINNRPPLSTRHPKQIINSESLSKLNHYCTKALQNIPEDKKDLAKIQEILTKIDTTEKLSTNEELKKTIHEYQANYYEKIASSLRDTPENFEEAANNYFTSAVKFFDTLPEQTHEKNTDQYHCIKEHIVSNLEQAGDLYIARSLQIKNIDQPTHIELYRKAATSYIYAAQASQEVSLLSTQLYLFQKAGEYLTKTAELISDKSTRLEYGEYAFAYFLPVIKNYYKTKDYKKITAILASLKKYLNPMGPAQQHYDIILFAMEHKLTEEEAFPPEIKKAILSDELSSLFHSLLSKSMRINRRITYVP